MIKNQITDEQFEKWIEKPEGLNLEFKKAENSSSKTKDLLDYCAALSNEGGGKLILGVENNRDITGTKAFQGTADTLSHYLLNSIGIRVDIEEKFYSKKKDTHFPYS